MGRRRYNNYWSNQTEGLHPYNRIMVGRSSGRRRDTTRPVAGGFLGVELGARGQKQEHSLGLQGAVRDTVYKKQNRNGSIVNIGNHLACELGCFICELGCFILRARKSWLCSLELKEQYFEKGKVYLVGRVGSSAQPRSGFQNDHSSVISVRFVQELELVVVSSNPITRQ